MPRSTVTHEVPSCRTICGMFFVVQAEDGIRDKLVTGVQTCALPISAARSQIGGTAMTREELDAALARLGLDVPEKEREDIAAAAHLIAEMGARLRPPAGRGVSAGPGAAVKFR